MHSSRHAACALLVTLAACGDDVNDTSPVTPGECVAPARVVAGACIEPGVQDNGCPAGSYALDGSCIAAGVPPAGCPEGFAAEPDGPCLPILPAERCGYGQMAIPGETTCRPIMSCGQGRWGDIPVDGTTEYVDATYAGNDSDGSEAKAWVSIQQAFTAAAPGGLIALAAGTYDGDVLIIDKPVRLWGVCPDLVHIRGVGTSTAALMVAGAAHGTEIVGVSLEGSDASSAVTGAQDVVYDRVWIRDSGSRRGLDLFDQLGAASVVLRDSLVERNNDVGIYVGGGHITIERSVVRDTQPGLNAPLNGRGIVVQPSCDGVSCDVSYRSSVHISSTVVEGNAEQGITVSSADLVLIGSVVRDTAMRSDGNGGGGVLVFGCDDEHTCPMPTRANAIISGVLLERNHSTSLRFEASDGLVEGVVVRDTQSDTGDLNIGRGFSAEMACSALACDLSRASNVQLRGVLVEDSYDLGMFVMGSNVTIEGSVIRRTKPRTQDGQDGRGLSIQMHCGDTCDGTTPSQVTALGLLVEDSHDMGIVFLGSTGQVSGSVVRATKPQPNGVFGDGFAVATVHDARANVAVHGSHIADNVRAGFANFGADTALKQNAITCSGFNLTAVAHGESPYSFDDQGGNLCGCPAADSECKAISPDIEPPAP
jgi:hypothetical protein